MNFALFGFDPLFVEVARALRQHETHSLRWACGAGPFAADLATLNQEVVLRDRWEDLASDATLDAVLVGSRPTAAGRGEEGPASASENPVRRLAQAGKHLLLARPESLPLMALYELAMISEESGAVIMPIQWEKLHPAFEPFEAPGDSTHDGPTRHIAFWRCIAPHGYPGASPNSRPRNLGVADATADGSGAPAASPTPQDRNRRSPEAFDAIQEANRLLQNHFARDALLLRFLAADFVHVASLFAPRPQITDEAPAVTDQVAVCISMVGALGDLCGWTCVSTRAAVPSARLTITTDAAITTFEWTDLRLGLYRTITSPAGRHTKWLGPWDAAEAVLNRFLAAIDREEPLADLHEAIRQSELAVAAARSMRRSRGVDLCHDEQSESSTFKGAMTSVGCGLLGLVLLALMITAAAEGLGLHWFHYAWYGIVPLLVVFLLLQFLGLISRQSETKESKRNA